MSRGHHGFGSIPDYFEPKGDSWLAQRVGRSNGLSWLPIRMGQAGRMQAQRGGRPRGARDIHPGARRTYSRRKRR